MWTIEASAKTKALFRHVYKIFQYIAKGANVLKKCSFLSLSLNWIRGSLERIYDIFQVTYMRNNHKFDIILLYISTSFVVDVCLKPQRKRVFQTSNDLAIWL